MTVQADIAAVLLASSPLMAVLTGGVYEQDDVGEISRQATAAAFDSTTKELKPCALVAEGTEIPRGGIDHSGQGTSVQTPVNVYFYERVGYSNIASALDLAFTLLNGQKIGSSTFRVEYENSIKNQVDPSLDCSMAVQRWMVVRLRS